MAEVLRFPKDPEEYWLFKAMEKMARRMGIPEVPVPVSVLNEILEEANQRVYEALMIPEGLLRGK